MPRETSSLEIEPDFNHTEVRLEQRPLVGWGMLAFLVVWATGFFGIMPVGWELFGFPAAAALMLFFALSLVWKRTASFSINANQVRIDAWTGLLARPARLALPLARIGLEHRSRFHVNKRRVYRLTLQSPGAGTHRIGALACTEEDLKILTEMIKEAEQKCLLDAGTAADVPDQLRTTMGTAGKQAT